jgi:hypothetical protein
MKTGSPLSDVVRRVDLLANQARDYVAPARNIRMTISEQASSLVLDDGTGAQPFDLTDLVHDQLAMLTGVPQAYYRRMQTEDPALLGSNVNAWLGRSSNRQLVRTLHRPSRPMVRAIVSDRFRPLDHRQLLEAVLPTLHEQGVEVLSSELTDTRLYVKAVNQRVTGEVRVGEVVKAGILISNSEVGLGALTIQPLIYTLRCTNGMIVEDTSLRRHHVGKRHDAADAVLHLLSDETRAADDRAFFLRVRDITRSALDEAVFRQHVSRLTVAASQILPAGHEERVVEVTAKRHHLSTTESAGVLAHLRAGGDLSLLGLSSAVTRYAQEVSSYDRSTDLERVGGRIIDLSKTEWNSLISVN